MQVDSNNKINSYLTFQVGKEYFCTSVGNVTNILEMVRITHVPKSPLYLKGVINLRGSILPVVDARIKFGMQDTEYTNNTCILVLELMLKNEIIKMGAIVDSVLEVLDINESEIMPPPSIGTNYKTEIVKGMINRDGNFIMLIDVSKVFLEDETIISQELTTELKKVH
jgi:purine-binding chemotaxis protein CheW